MCEWTAGNWKENLRYIRFRDLIYVLDVFLRHKKYFKWLFNVWVLSVGITWFWFSSCVVFTRVIKFFIFQNICGSISTCVAENSLVKSALLPLILRPCCFKYIFSLLFVSASTSFSFFQEYKKEERSFLLLFFSPLHPRTQDALHTFYTQSWPRCTGNRTLAKTYLQRRTISLVEQFLYLDTYKLTLQSNQTVYIYIDQYYCY